MGEGKNGNEVVEENNKGYADGNRIERAVTDGQRRKVVDDRPGIARVQSLV
jgi:hypothetical protein